MFLYCHSRGGDTKNCFVHVKRGYYGLGAFIWIGLDSLLVLCFGCSPGSDQASRGKASMHLLYSVRL